MIWTAEWSPGVILPINAAFCQFILRYSMSRRPSPRDYMSRASVSSGVSRKKTREQDEGLRRRVRFRSGVCARGIIG